MIYVIEDDAAIREIEMYTLKVTGFESHGFGDGAAAWEALVRAKEVPDLVLLDVMLPTLGGIDILKRIREDERLREVPVILATAKGEEYDRIQGLDLGADDYLVKPFSMLEMVSRVKAVLRRTQSRRPKKDIVLDDFRLSVDEQRLYLHGEAIPLTKKEFGLLRLFLSNPESVLSREQLFCTVWEYNFMGDSRTLDMHIRSLRRKLGEEAYHIETIRMVGYRWKRS